MIRPPPAWPLALVVLLAAGCSLQPAPHSGAPTAAELSGARRIMVTFALRPEIRWKQAVDELAANYDLAVLFRWPLESLDQECVVFGLPDNRTAEEIVTRVATDPRVRLAQPIHRFRVLNHPTGDRESAESRSADPPSSASPPAYNDPHSHLQHGLAETRVIEAHLRATGRGVKVAVIDTGIDAAHPDLEGRVVKARNFVEGETAFASDVHGTAVAGVIAAGANNARGIVGVAPGATLFALKACWQEPPTSRNAVCDSYTLAQAVDFAINEGAQVVNFSLTGPRDPLLSELIEVALKRGIAVLAAADGSPSGGFPANQAGVLAVYGLPATAKLASVESASGGPSAGAHPPEPSRQELTAPSVDILSTAPSDSYDFFSGSSLAVAQVTGLTALLLERRPELTPAQLAALIRRTAHPLARTADGTGEPAWSLIDAAAAVAALADDAPRAAAR